MKSRAQAALEFLSTYGFAFLVILVMIGALSYFGVLSPGNLLPDRCTVNPEFSCMDFIVYEDGDTSAASTGHFKLVLQNNVGNSMDISALELQSQFIGTSETLPVVCAESVTESNSGQGTNISVTTDAAFTGLRGGEAAQFECDINPEGATAMPAAGEKVRINYVGQYKEAGRSFERTLQGEVFATVQAGGPGP